MPLAADRDGQDPDFGALKARLSLLLGWDLGRFKDNYLRRRVDARRRAVGAESWAAYAQRLAADPGELARLRDRLTVNVTEFLRDGDVWQGLERDVLPGLAAAAAARPLKELRLWSAGCSSGEEAYSLAMLALRAARDQGGGVRVRVLASDMDPGALEKAREGRYDGEALRPVPRAWLDEFFTAEGRHLRAGARLRAAVHCRALDLFSSPAPQGIDLLLCRNVMIYFSKDMQQRLLHSFHQALRQGGGFVTGKTETIMGPVRDRFRCVSATARIFRRA